MKFLVTKVSYRITGGTLLVDIFGRSDGGERVHKVLTGVRPYFYTLDKPTKQSSMITGVTREGKDIFGNSLYKIYTRFPMDVAKIREWFKPDRHFEANVLFEQRVRIDYKCFGVIQTPEKKLIVPEEIHKVDEEDIKPRYAIMDIETDKKAKPENPNGEVLSITIRDSVLKKYLTIIVGSADKVKARQILDDALLDMLEGDTEKFEKYRFKSEWIVLSVKTEEELFARLSDYFEKYQPDVCTGWYFNDFDWKYLIARATQERYEMPDFKSREAFDMLPGYSRIHEGASRSSLEWCANEDFKFGKIKYDGDLSDLYRMDRDRFLAYNLWDVYLCELIDEKRNILGFHNMLSNVSSCPLHKTVNNSWIIDAYMLQFVHGEYVLPTNPINPGTEKIKGAYVHDPANGIFDYVLLFDLKSEYPSLIISSNLSPETRWTGNDPPPDPENYYRTPVGSYFKKSPIGILPKMMMALMGKRGAMKGKRDTFDFKTPGWNMYEDMQRSFKEMTNSVYGVMRYKGFRLADRRVAEAITAFARENVKWIIKEIRERGYVDLYADTDSVFAQSKHTDLEEQIEEGHEIEDLVNAGFVEFGKVYGLKDLKIKLEFKSVYDIWAQFSEDVMIKGQMERVGAKRYIGLISWNEGKYLVDEPLETRKEVKGFEVKRVNVAPFAKKIQHKVIDKILTRVTPEDIRKYIRGVHKAMVTGQIRPESLAIPASVGQEKYDPVPAFIRSVYYTKEILGIDMTAVGSDFIWCYGHIKNKPLVHCKGPNDCTVAIPAGEKFPEDFVLNTEKMIERNLKGPLDSIVKGIGLGDMETVLASTRMVALSSFA